MVGASWGGWGQVGVVVEPIRDPETGRNHEGSVGSSRVELVRGSKLDKGWLIAGMTSGMASNFVELFELQRLIMLEGGSPLYEQLALPLVSVEIRAAWGSYDTDVRDKNDLISAVIHEGNKECNYQSHPDHVHRGSYVSNSLGIYTPMGLAWGGGGGAMTKSPQVGPQTHEPCLQFEV